MRQGWERLRSDPSQWLLPAVGLVAAVVAAAARPADARAALDQSWPPFVLVAGLLVIGLIADDERLFAWAGHQLARSLKSGVALLVGAALTIGLVTALLNLDTSVAFLTPVLVYTARSRGGGLAPLLYGCLLLSNAGSLFLPGSNLTNLIVFGHLGLTGGQFLSHMWFPALTALITTTAVIGVIERRSLRVAPLVPARPQAPVVGTGLIAIAAATVFVVVLPTPAPFVAATGAVAAAIWIRGKRGRLRPVISVLGLPVLVGLLGLAVAFGTLGRAWAGPQSLLSHLDQWGTAGLGAVCAVAFNNLPAASLLAAKPPARPFALLIGLNLGPNLFVTGSLAWALWLRGARMAGAEPSISRAARTGLVAVPISMVLAVAALSLTGAR